MLGAPCQITNKICAGSRDGGVGSVAAIRQNLTRVQRKSWLTLNTVTDSEMVELGWQNSASSCFTNIPFRQAKGARWKYTQSDRLHWYTGKVVGG